MIRGNLGAVAAASFKLGLSLSLAYRLEVVARLVSASVVVLLNWSLWTAIFQGRDTVAGRTAPELTTYVVVAWVATTFTGSRVDEVLAGRFRTGEIAVDLLRPWNLQLHSYLRDLGRACAALVLTTVPMALWTGALLPLRLPERPATWALILPALLLGHAIGFGFAWLVGVASFRLKNATGLAHLKSTVVAMFSGALIPLDLYPGAMRQIVLWLPFQGISHTPANLFTEHLPLVEAWQPLAVQAAWAIGLAVAGGLAFRGAMRSLVVQGG